MGEVTATESEVPPRRAAALIEAGDADLIDVRRPYEWEAGRIAGARHIEVNELTAVIAIRTGAGSEPASASPPISARHESATA